MNVPKGVMKLRTERASELTRYAQLIEKYCISGSTFKLYEAARILKDKTLAFHTPKKNDYSCWGYEVDDFSINVPVNGRHVTPSSIKKIEISIDTKILCDYQLWETLNDPFVNLNFRAKIRGSDVRGTYSFGFHIDKHIGNVESEEVHPLYHIQYLPKIDESISNMGEVLSMDTPRMMHAPVDIILGIDLILSNFAPNIWNKMRDEYEYQAIFEKYQRNFWKPYFHTIASHWTFSQNDIVWDNQFHICPNLTD